MNVATPLRVQMEEAHSAATAARPVVLVLIGAFWPGHDATGPNQSLRALATALGDEFAFKVIARDRPFGADRALAQEGRWIDRGFAEFRYCRVDPLRGARGLARILRETPHDILMMNGFFDRDLTLPALIARRMGLVPRRPAILSIRGEFAQGALGLKSGRKRAYLWCARQLGLVQDVWLHATVRHEAEDIAREFPHARGVLSAPCVRQLAEKPAARRTEAREGPLRMAFLGRIARVKNLDYALRILSQVSTPSALDIFGPVQEADHWRECCALIASLPAHVSVALKGEIPNDRVPDTLADYDLLFLPTRGENFGHAILDALSVGVPVLISDRTPFHAIEQEGAGWSLPLEAPERFVFAIESFARMRPAAVRSMSAAARGFAERILTEHDSVGANRRMLATALNACAPSNRREP